MPETFIGLPLLGAGNIKKKICQPLFSIKLFLVLETDTTQRFSQFSVARKTVGVCPRVRSGAEDREIAFGGTGIGWGPGLGDQLCSDPSALDAPDAP